MLKMEKSQLVVDLSTAEEKSRPFKPGVAAPTSAETYRIEIEQVSLERRLVELALEMDKVRLELQYANMQASCQPRLELFDEQIARIREKAK